MGHTVAVDVDLLVGLHEVLASEDLRGWLMASTSKRSAICCRLRAVVNGHVETWCYNNRRCGPGLRADGGRRRNRSRAPGASRSPQDARDPRRSMGFRVARWNPVNRIPAVVRECRENSVYQSWSRASWARADRRKHGTGPVCGPLTKGQPTSSATHDLLRWLAMDELATVQWLEPDNKLLSAVERHVSRRPPRHR
jgi:hypothetical protein